MSFLIAALLWATPAQAAECTYYRMRGKVVCIQSKKVRQHDGKFQKEDHRKTTRVYPTKFLNFRRYSPDKRPNARSVRKNVSHISEVTCYNYTTVLGKNLCK